MNDTDTFKLDRETLGHLTALAKDAGMPEGEYIRKILLERAAEHLRKQETGASFFLPQNGGVPPNGGGSI